MAKYDEKQRLLGEKAQISKGIADQRCRTCGTILNKEKLDELQVQLKELNLKIESLTEIPEPNLEFEIHSNILSKMLNKVEERGNASEIHNRINEIDYEIAVKNKRLADIRDSLVDQDEDAPKRLEIKIRGLENEKGRLQGLIQAEKVNLEEWLETKRGIEQKISSIPQDELKILGRRIDTAKTISELLENAVSKYRDQKKIEVQEIATNIFRRIKSKTDFDRLQINDQFGLNIVTTNGLVLDKGELRSAGEEQIVALSLIGALNKCADVNAPVFMDTPFGRLDVDHSERILSYVPELAKQVTLLVTDKEFRPGDERFLAGRISTDLTVVHLSVEKGSDIRLTSGGEI